MPATPPGVVISIIYKRTPDFNLDLGYFFETHVPLCDKAWAPHGLLGATVTEGSADSEYAYIIAIRFKTMEGWQNAVADQEQMGKLMADVPKLTNGTPEFVVGKVVEGGYWEL